MTCFIIRAAKLPAFSTAPIVGIRWQSVTTGPAYAVGYQARMHFLPAYLTLSPQSSIYIHASVIQPTTVNTMSIRAPRPPPNPIGRSGRQFNDNRNHNRSLLPPDGDTRKKKGYANIPKETEVNAKLYFPPPNSFRPTTHDAPPAPDRPPGDSIGGGGGNIDKSSRRTTDDDEPPPHIPCVARYPNPGRALCCCLVVFTTSSRWCGISTGIGTGRSCSTASASGGTPSPVDASRG